MYLFQISVNGLDKAGSTPLHWAAHGGHIDCLQSLLGIPNCQVSVQVCVIKFYIKIQGNNKNSQKLKNWIIDLIVSFCNELFFKQDTSGML